MANRGTIISEYTLEEALTTDYKEESVYEEEARTNIAMSVWIHKVFADIHDIYDLSLAQIMARTIRLGTSIMQRDYKDQFVNLSHGWAQTLGAIAYITRLQKGDLIQLAIYHAVARSTEILNEWQCIHAQSVIDGFGVRLLDTSEFIYTLATMFGKQGE